MPLKSRSVRSPWWASEQLIASVQDYRRHRANPGPLARVLRNWARARHLFFSILTASDIDPNAELGPGLKLPHPNGVVIHQAARVGPDCMIMQQVTIGQLADPEAPVIGRGVYIGAGAKVLGPIVIGDGAAIGANAVVLQNVPAGCTAVGVPAKVIAKRSQAAVGS